MGVATAANIGPAQLPVQRRLGTVQHFLQLLLLGRLHQIPQGPHAVPVKDVVGIAGDEHQLKPAVRRPEPACGLHAVQLPPLHIQKHQVQFPSVVLQPAEQPLAGGELEKLPLRPPLLQHPLQGGTEHQPGVVDIVADADAQHPCSSISRPRRKAGLFCGRPARRWGYSIILPLYRQTKVDSKHAVYDIPAAKFSKLDIPPTGNDSPVCGGHPAAVS